MAQGFLALVLQAHLPFVRHPEHDRFLEEDWLYEAIVESYLPLCEVLEGLERDGIPYRLTLAISPTLTSMLRDDLLRARAERHIARLSDLVDRELARTRHDPRLLAIARHYRERLDRVSEIWRRTGGDVVGAFSRLAEGGNVDLCTTAATHAYLPLWQRHPQAVRAQVHVAVREHVRCFGRDPAGIWLPECGFYTDLDRELARAGLRYFLVDSHGIEHAVPRPRFGVHAPVYCPGTGLAAFGRDPEPSRDVWSREAGYPGDPDYRDFYRDIGWDLPLEDVGPWVQPTGERKNTGIKYHRITGPGPQKDLYDPERARARADEHAADFLARRERQVQALATTLGRPALVVAPYDAELFGHWWYEGPWWLDRLVRRIAAGDRVVTLVHLSEYLRRMPTQQVAAVAPSSWGENGYHEYWLSEANAWIYPHAHRAADEMRDLARGHLDATPPAPVDRALRQAARELMLAQASDWAFILRAGTMAGYARGRVEGHLRRFRALAQQIRSGRIDERWLARLEATDNLFPDLDWRLFA